MIEGNASFVLVHADPFFEKHGQARLALSPTERKSIEREAIAHEKMLKAIAAHAAICEANQPIHVRDREHSREAHAREIAARAKGARAGSLG